MTNATMGVIAGRSLASLRYHRAEPFEVTPMPGGPAMTKW